MAKQYQVSSSISKGQFFKLYVLCGYGIKAFLLELVFLYMICWRVSGGILIVDGILIAVMTGTVVACNLSVMFSYYKEEQDLIFSEDGIRRKEDAVVIHWVNLCKARQKDGWLIFRGMNRKIFMIDPKHLDEEGRHFMYKRLRGDIHEAE